MSKKLPPRNEIVRARQLLTAEQADESADVRWARGVLAGEAVKPPGDALRPEVAYALVEELVERQQADPLARLAGSSHKTVSKAARTALHRLRTHKVEVDVPLEPDQPHLGTGQVATQQGLRSMATIYDSRWERLIWIGDDAPSGVRIYQARTSALYGLLDLQSGTVSRKEYRQKTRQVLGDLGGEMVDMSEARWLVHEAARRCEEGGRSLPRGFVLASQALGPSALDQHPALALAPPPEADLTALYSLPELRYWQPDREFLHRLALRFDEASTSRLVLSDVQKQERLAGILERSLADFYTEQRCRACWTLLVDTAHLLLARGETETAGRLRAAAERFALPPEQVTVDPFARRFIERVVEGQADRHEHPHHDHAHDHAHDHEEEEEERGPSSGSGLIIP